MEDIWIKFKDIVFEGIERFVPHKILKQNPDTEYYNKEVKRLKRRVRKAYNLRKMGVDYKAELKRLSNKLLSAKRNALDNFLNFILQNEGKETGKMFHRLKTVMEGSSLIPSKKQII